ncbi:Gfo/Idh/MocA family oxidoreductase [Amycolatopsis sp. NPDC051372]|uniref:Gfo/Idh/MocA family protein n=1 Tax=Amycolatopsis sp. NPDC051372 TaxID=3155669 RepID=UPI00342A9DE3
MNAVKPRLRVGMVGTGYWAGHVHLPSLRAHPDVELVGIWGRNNLAAERLGEQFGVDAYPDLDGLIDTVDVVDLSISPAAQADIATRAAKAGKHLLIEKPIADTLKAGAALADAVRVQGVAAVTLLIHRLRPERAAWLDARRAEKPTSAHAHWHSTAMRPDSPYAGSLWRKDFSPLWDVGPHIIHQLESVLGPVVAVSAFAVGQRTRVALTMIHAGGATSAVAIDMASSRDQPLQTIDVLTGTGMHNSPPLSIDGVLSHTHALRLLRDEIRSGVTEHGFGVDVGLRTLAVLEATDRSMARDGAVVDVDIV